MSEWKVFSDKIEIFPHPNADKMELGKIGTFQVVVGKGLYKTGDRVVFAPKRSILPIELRGFFCNEETGKSYLHGNDYDRVASIRLRGEESEGAILPLEYVESKIHNFSDGEDLSEKLRIKEYIPTSSGQGPSRTPDGKSVRHVTKAIDSLYWRKHDVEQFRIFANEFVDGEPVILSEKIHGQQINVIKDRFDKIAVSSKGRAEKNLVLREYPIYPIWQGKTLKQKLQNLWKIISVGSRLGQRNTYWKNADEAGLLSFVKFFRGQEVQIFGEVVPVQKGFNYGFSKPTVLVFRLVIGGVEQHYGEYERDPEWDTMAFKIRSSGPGRNILRWAPILYEGPYDLQKLLPLVTGMETVSGKSLHIKEGGVLIPATFRKVKGTPLIVKLLNPKYVGSDDDPS